jgi:hypothetical protein
MQMDQHQLNVRTDWPPGVNDKLPVDKPTNNIAQSQHVTWQHSCGHIT